MVGGYFCKTQDLAFRGGTEGRGQLLARHVHPADEHISLVVKIADEHISLVVKTGRAILGGFLTQSVHWPIVKVGVDYFKM